MCMFVAWVGVAIDGTPSARQCQPPPSTRITQVCSLSLPFSHSSESASSTAVRRILQEAKELANDQSTDYTAAPLEVCLTLPPFIDNYLPIWLQDDIFVSCIRASSSPVGFSFPNPRNGTAPSVVLPAQSLREASTISASYSLRNTHFVPRQS